MNEHNDLIERVELAVEYDARCQEAEGIGAAAIQTATERRLEARANLQQFIAALQARVVELEGALRPASLMCGLYAQFIRNHVKADDLELHPYLPELEQVEADADAALAKQGAA